MAIRRAYSKTVLTWANDQWGYYSGVDTWTQHKRLDQSLGDWSDIGAWKSAYEWGNDSDFAFDHQDPLYPPPTFFNLSFTLTVPPSFPWPGQNQIHPVYGYYYYSHSYCYYWNVCYATGFWWALWDVDNNIALGYVDQGWVTGLPSWPPHGNYYYLDYSLPPTPAIQNIYTRWPLSTSFLNSSGGGPRRIALKYLTNYNKMFSINNLVCTMYNWPP